MGLRAALRARIVGAVDEVVARHRAEQNHELRAQIDASVRAEVDRIVAEIRDVEIRDRRDTIAAAERDAVASTARFVQQEMREARSFAHPVATLEHALTLAPSGGLALEFGVFTGITLAIIAAARSGRVYGFDSFEGLPENWRSGFDTGAFAVDGLPDVPGADLVVGLFADTLPGFLAAHPGPVDLLHLDADLHSSTACVLETVGPRLRPGSVVVFDEFFNYPGWERHEARAWREHVDAHGIAFRYEAYTHDNEQVVVRLL
ncbi:MAG: class I SAM-dependent methyltransferase [Pseudonocardia sp.]|nr:class I SAM-dependent methyltransferase [Pseudonocardia sp.]